MNNKHDFRLFFTLCFVLIFLNEYFNILSLSPHFWFNDFDQYSESLVLGGLLKGECKVDFDGNETKLGRLVCGNRLDGTSITNLQYELVGTAPQVEVFRYEPYFSQFGLQTTIMKPWHDFLRYIQYRIGSAKVRGLAGLSGNLERKFERNFVILLKFPVVLASAIVLSLFCFWFTKEFGFMSGMASFCLIMLGGWITVFSSNLYWMIFSMFAPTVFMAWHGLAHDPKWNKYKIFTWSAIGILVFYALFTFKCLMGYEYLSTIALSATTPVAYYYFLKKIRFVHFAATALAMAAASIFGLASAMYIHFNHLRSLLGYEMAKTQLILIATKNTHKLSGEGHQIPGDRLEALDSNPFFVILFYIFSPANKEAVFICPALILIPGIFYSFKTLRDSHLVHLHAIAAASLYSIAAPLSWFILAKSHSAQHFHYNFLLWYMPTLFFCSVLLIKYFTSGPMVRIPEKS